MGRGVNRKKRAVAFVQSMIIKVIVAGVDPGNSKEQNAWLHRNVGRSDGSGLAERGSDFRRSREHLRPIVCLNGPVKSFD